MRQVIGRDSPVYSGMARTTQPPAQQPLGRAAVWELAGGPLFPVQAVLTQLDGEDRPVAVFAEVGRPRDPGHPAPFCDRITFDFSMSSIAPLHVARDKTCARAGC